MKVTHRGWRISIAFLLALPALSLSSSIQALQRGFGVGTPVAESGNVAGFASMGGAIAVDQAGNLYAASSNYSMVRKITPSGAESSFAGVSIGFGGDGGPAALAQLRNPQGLAVDRAGNVFIADTGNNRIRKVDTSGRISTIKDTLVSPSGLATDAKGNLYVAETGRNRVVRVSSSGAIVVVAGSGTAGFRGDGGPAIAAELNAPSTVAVDSTGILYIGDRMNDRVRKVTSDGKIKSVFARSAAPNSVALDRQLGVAVDGKRVLYVAR